MSERALFHSALYRTRCAFADVNMFLERFEPYFDALGGGHHSALMALDRAVAEGCSHGVIASEADAMLALLAEDLGKIRVNLRSVNEEGVSGGEFASLIAKLLDLLRGVGIKAEEPYLTIVDKFPKPFDSFRWSAFCPDRADEERFGIKSGIYLLREKLRPYYSQILVSHELIHTIPGRIDPGILAMGLEEGLAEVVGSLYLGSKVFGSEIARNVFIYGRYNHHGQTMWDLYVDHTRQAALIYRRFGMNGLVELVNGGRRVIHRAEASILSGHMETMRLDSVPFASDAQLDSLLWQVLESFIPRLVVSPLAAYLLRYVEEGKTFAEICAQADVPAENGRAALEAASRDTTLFIADHDRVSYSNVRFYREIEEKCHTSVIRYRLKSDGAES